MNKIVTIFTFLITIILFPGCSKWKSVGKVDMSKLIALDEVWEKREELIGQVVTLEFDTVNRQSRCCITPLDINGRNDFKAAYYVTLPDFWKTTSRTKWEDSISQTRDIVVSYDTVWTGEYIIQYIINADKQEFDHPSWIKKENEYISIENQDYFDNTIVYSPKKIFSGVLIGGYLNKSYGKFYCSTERCLLFIPTGYKFSKGHLEDINY